MSHHRAGLRYSMKTPVKLLMALGTLLVCCCFPAPSEQPAGKRKKPTIDILISAGDSWWFGSWLPVDSPASLRDSVQMWSDLFDIKRVYWRGGAEGKKIGFWGV